jgi:hypothetical protein
MFIRSKLGGTGHSLRLQEKGGAIKEITFICYASKQVAKAKDSANYSFWRRDCCPCWCFHQQEKQPGQNLLVKTPTRAQEI